MDLILHSLFFGAVGLNTRKVFKWTVTGSQLSISRMLVTKMTHGYLVHRFDKSCILVTLQKTHHIVVPGKQEVIGVDGVEDTEEYNEECNEISLFTNLPQKKLSLEATIKKDEKPWARKDGESRIVTA